jgi:hypothetical protein
MRFERHMIAIPNNCFRQIMQIMTNNLHYIHPNNHVILGLHIHDYSTNWIWNALWRQKLRKSDVFQQNVLINDRIRVNA